MGERDRPIRWRADVDADPAAAAYFAGLGSSAGLPLTRTASDVRNLLVTNRELRSDDDVSACDDAWIRVRVAVETAGGRAWRFRDPAKPLRLVEFIEWTEPSDPLCDDAVNLALSALGGIAGTVTEQLLEEH